MGMKKQVWRGIAALCLSASLMLGNTSAAAAAAPAKTSILLDGFPLPFPVEPVIVQGSTLVPFRAIAEAMGIQVQWNPQDQSITARKESKEVRLWLNKPVALVNGQAVSLPVSPREVNGSTLIPLSFFSNQFGAQVSWDGATKTVSIVTPPKRLYSMAFYAISSFAERAAIPSFDAVSFGWSRIDGEGRLTLAGKDFYWPQPAGEVTPEKIVAETRAGGTTPYLMVFASDGTGELSKLQADRTLRDKAIAQIVQLAQEKGFAGITLDFEGLGLDGDTAQAKLQYTEFVSLLSEQARQLGLKLALVLHPLNGAYQGYDYFTLGALADELIVMAYAYENEKQPEPLAKVNEAIRLALAEVPKEKLLLGISMGSENEQSVGAKLGLVKRYGLKGIAIWRLGLIGQPAFAEMKKSIAMKGN
ncbi:glycosyl hydrolase [Brevibacillus sp. SYP-B805]|nr:glycosyl hydrolase [Brevibacillus sp. SYP-B805]